MKVFRAIAMTHFCVCRRCNKTNMPTTLQHLGSLLCFYIQVQILRTFQNLMIKTENSKSIIISNYIQICIWKEFRNKSTFYFYLIFFFLLPYENYYLPIFQVHCWDRVPLHWKLKKTRKRGNDMKSHKRIWLSYIY